MGEEKRYSEKEANRFFAVQFHNQTRDLLDKQAHSQEDRELLVATAYASLRHWLDAGTAVNRQRGEWLLSRVYAVLGKGTDALHHARLCLDFTEQSPDEMADFDFAFAYEGMARASAAAGNPDEARIFISMAGDAGKKIQDREDREIFFSDFDAGNWFGVR